MDAVDGKQARKTKKASPLGQLVDHGSDCLTSTFINFNAIVILGAGNDCTAVWFCFVGLLTVFYIANWAEHFTGVLVTAKGNVGVTEVQFVFMAFNVISGIYGEDIWSYRVFGGVIRNRTLSYHLGLHSGCIFCNRRRNDNRGLSENK